jgi:predicted N-acetyltransferase YhbS
MERAIDAARAGGEREMLLVGDAPYYGRFGFSAERTGKLAMPGPFEPSRLLGLGLVPEATEEAEGLISPAGAAAAPVAAAATHVPRSHRRPALPRAA